MSGSFNESNGSPEVTLEAMPELIMEKLLEQRNGLDLAVQFEKKQGEIAEGAGMKSDEYIAFITGEYIRNVMGVKRGQIPPAPHFKIGRPGNGRKIGSHTSPN